jgi:hypothetical protein
MSRRKNLFRDKLIQRSLHFKSGSGSTRDRYEANDCRTEIATITPKGMKEKGQQRLSNAANIANETLKRFMR